MFRVLGVEEDRCVEPQESIGIERYAVATLTLNLNP